MTLPRLQALSRQLTMGTQTGYDDQLQNKLLTILEHTIEQKAKAKVEAAEKLQKKAEHERDELRKEVARVNDKLEQARKDHNTRMETCIDSMKKECERMENNFKEELNRVQTLLEKMKTEAAAEQRALASMVADHRTAMDMCTRMEKEILGIKSVKPVQPPVTPTIMPAVEPKPVTMIPKRDETGRIVSISVVPTT